MSVALLASGAWADTTEPALYRIFLRDGEGVVTVGDYARVADRVVFALPLRLTDSGVHTQLVTLPAQAVDWTTTKRYADAVRAARYADTRGEQAFAELSADVARVLNEIAFTDDEEIRRSLARTTKQQILNWSETHYGYRADDLLEIVSLLDAAAPDTATRQDEPLSLRLVATTARAPDVPLLPSPTQRQLIAQTLSVSRRTPVPAERVSLLQAALALLSEPDRSLDPAWRAARQAETRTELERELRIDKAYATLQQMALGRASTFAEHADVHGVQSILDAVRARDAELGHRRPDQLAALIESLESRLREAQAHRLRRDRRHLHVAAARAYERDVADVVTSFDARRGMLDDIRLLAGPDASDLPRLSTEFSQTADRLDRVSPPAEVAALHRLIRQALQLAGSAARRRYQAVQDGNLPEAWDAASAAAGAIMLFDRAVRDLEQAVMP